MTADPERPQTDPVGKPGSTGRGAWLAVPILFGLTLALWAADYRTVYEAPRLLFLGHFLFGTMTSSVIVYLVGGNFLARGTPGLLLLTCGVAFWGLAGTTATLVAPHGLNASLTVHNLCIWCAGFCHLLGVVFAPGIRSPLVRRGWWLFAGAGLTLGVIAFICLSTVAGLTPVFFIQGTGGTFVRHLVLGTACGMFLLSAIVLRLTHPPTRSAFTHWYELALFLMATALFGLMVQSVQGSALGWTARGTQWVAGIYLVMAAIAASRELGERQITLAVAPRDVGLRYALAVIFVAAGLIGRLVFLRSMGTQAAYITFFPAVILAALYGGFGPGLLASFLAAIAAHFWITPKPFMWTMEAKDLLVSLLFLVTGAMLTYIATAMQQAQLRASAAEAEVKLAAERKRASDALRASEDRVRQQLAELEAFYQEAPLGLCVVDRDLRFRRINARLAEMNGFSIEEHLGKTITELMPSLKAEAEAVLARVIESGEPQRFEARGTTPAQPGVERIWDERWYPLHEPGTGIARVGVVVEEITERKRTEAALALAQEKLRQHAEILEQTVADRTARLRDSIADLEAFSYSIAHDMRAPLRSMRGFADILLHEHHDKLDVEGQDYLRRIARSAERLDALIQDVLNYSRVVHMELRLERVDVETLIGDIVRSYPNLQPFQNHIVMQKPLPAVHANLAALTQVISNLLGNGVKFVARGAQPRIVVRADNAREGNVRLWFEDNGIGISPEATKRIFQMFQRAHRADVYEGTGMGLAIVRKAVERMGGAVGVESELNSGSRFWVELKRDPAP